MRGTILQCGLRIDGVAQDGFGGQAGRFYRERVLIDEPGRQRNQVRRGQGAGHEFADGLSG